MGCEKLDQNVSRRVPVAIKMRVALGAVEALITAQLVMQMSTCSAGLGGVLFRDDVYLAPRVLACLVQKMLPEAEVAQSQHGFRCVHHLGERYLHCVCNVGYYGEFCELRQVCQFPVTARTGAHARR